MSCWTSIILCMKKVRVLSKAAQDVLLALGLFSLYAIVLSGIRFITTDTTDLWFLIWNLFLSWLPLCFAAFLFVVTSKSGLVWSGRNVLLFMFWLLFLPNAFYVITDFVHLRGYLDDPERLFDIVLLTTYALLGAILGVIALLLVHIRAVQRFGGRGHWLPVATLLLSGFAIYLGRYLRWNSWDIIINPFGLLFDVSDRIIHPTSHPATFSTTLLFFSFYGLLYLLAWRLYRLASAQAKSHVI